MTFVFTELRNSDLLLTFPTTSGIQTLSIFVAVNKSLVFIRWHFSSGIYSIDGNSIHGNIAKGLVVLIPGDSIVRNSEKCQKILYKFFYVQCRKCNYNVRENPIPSNTSNYMSRLHM